MPCPCSSRCRPRLRKRWGCPLPRTIRSAHVRHRRRGGRRASLSVPHLPVQVAATPAPHDDESLVGDPASKEPLKLVPLQACPLPSSAIPPKKATTNPAGRMAPRHTLRKHDWAPPSVGSSASFRPFGSTGLPSWRCPAPAARSRFAASNSFRRTSTCHQGQSRQSSLRKGGHGHSAWPPCRRIAPEESWPEIAASSSTHPSSRCPAPLAAPSHFGAASQRIAGAM